MAPPPGPYSGTSTLALVARASAFSLGLVYGSIKLKVLKAKAKYGCIKDSSLKRDTTAMISSPNELGKLCDPPTKERKVEVLIEPNNTAESQTGCKVEEPNASKYTYCDICKNRDHDLEMCPDRFGKVITVCSVCGHLPCKNEADDHKEHHYVCLLYCHLCDEIGGHLTPLCPDMESDLGNEDWDSDTNDDN
ncbi:hypothetical protein ACLB2K_015336 [Fragaria x ananassa]